MPQILTNAQVAKASVCAEKDFEAFNRCGYAEIAKKNPDEVTSDPFSIIRLQKKGVSLLFDFALITHQGIFFFNSSTTAIIKHTHNALTVKRDNTIILSHDSDKANKSPCVFSIFIFSC